MAELSTKQKILVASIRLFNENGLANVRLQQIADEIGISVGNLAYHFRNKGAIVNAVNEGLDKEISGILSTYRLYPNLLDFDNQLTRYYVFLQKYPFYFLDLQEIERSHPHIYKKRSNQTAKMVRQIRKRFDFNLQRGIIKPEPRSGIYDNLAKSIWILITFSMPQSSTGSKKGMSAAEFKRTVWNQVFPYFTEKGMAEYDQLIIPILDRHSRSN